MKIKFLYLLLMGLMIHCSPVIHIAHIEESNINIQELEADPSVSDLIQPYKDILDEEMNDVIGTCEKNLTKGRPESTLGNWFTDALASAANDIFDKKVDFVAQNYGGLRIPSIGKGPITKRTIYELMPFDNMLVLVEVEAEELIRFINQMAALGGWPQNAALRYIIKNNQASEITINGLPIDMNRTYHIGVPDYIANGGNNAFYLVDNNRDDPGLLLHDLVISQIIKNTAAGININSKLDQRISSTE